jgi:hypothetical protein
MPRKYIAAVLVALAFGVVLSTASSAKVSSLPKLSVKTVCPAQVTPETATACSLVLKNTGTAMFRSVSLHFSPAEIMTHSSVPCKKFVGFYKPHQTCGWTIHNFRAGAKYLVKLTLSFPTQDSAGNVLTKFLVLGEAKGTSPAAFAMPPGTFTVHYISG